MSGDATKFLDGVYPDVPAGHAVLLWTLPDRQSHWCKDAASAAERAAQLGETRDVYLGVGTRLAGLGPSKRGGDDEVSGLAGLVADFDLLGPGHQKTNLPRDRAEVGVILSRLPLQPSAIVQTGGGIHCWWLFAELWMLDSEAERQKAKALSRGWAGRIKAIAREQRLDVDAVHDLARVLRVPGTLNHKNGGRRPVTLESLSDQRFQPSDFEEWAVEILESIKMGLGGLILRDSANPPAEKFDALRINEPKFDASWLHKRKDMQDQSASAYDYSLANFAVAAGWDDQEITDLLIARRRTHHDDLKLREDYYARTIARCRRDHEARAVTKEVESFPPREKAIAKLKGATGIDVERIIRNGEAGGKNHYVVVIAGGREHGMGDLRSFRTFQTWWDLAFELAAAAPKVAPKGPEWREILADAQALIEERVHEEMSEAELLRGWLRSYTQHAIPDFGRLGAEQRAGILETSQCFIEDGLVHFQIQHFIAHLAMQRIEVVPMKLASQLAQIGFESKKKSVRIGEKVTGRNFWRGAPLE